MAEEAYIGEIMMWAGNFAPRGWAFCDGQLLPINQNQALFSLLGTLYGGNGTSNFALPDLRGRVPRHFSSGEGLNVGSRGGSGTLDLSPAGLPVPTEPYYNRVAGQLSGTVYTGPPTIALNFVICLYGVYPCRD